MTEYAKGLSPLFGSAMPNGSCNAYIVVHNGEHGDSKSVCGYPMRADGYCTNRNHHHPKEPK